MFIFPLNVSKIPGIGEKTTEAFKLMGINKVEELANCDTQSQFIIYIIPIIPIGPSNSELVESPGRVYMLA